MKDAFGKRDTSRIGAKQVRLFIAAYPPTDASSTMLGELDALELPDIRPTTLDQVHLTLFFIGPVDPRDVEQITESASRAASGIAPFTLGPLRLIALPERGRARLIACETDAPPGMMELHRRLVGRLARHEVRRSGGRVEDGFLPHLTLGRFAKGREPSRAALPSTLGGAGIPSSAPAFVIDSISIMRSVLLPAGAEHRELVSIELNG